MPIVNLANYPTFTAVNLTSDPGFDPVPKPIPQCMEVRLNWTLEDSKPAHNVLHVRYPAGYPGGVTLANTLLNNISGLLNSSLLRDQLTTTTTLTGVSLRDKGALDQPYSDSSGSPLGGIAVGESLPNEVSAALTERTAISGRSGRGRIYLAGFAASCLAPGNVMSAPLKTALDAFAQGLISAMNTGGLIMCLALPSRVAYTGKTGTEHPARVARTQDVTQVICRDNHWDSQRRRGLR